MRVITKASTDAESLFPSRLNLQDYSVNVKNFLQDVVLVKDHDLRESLQSAKILNLDKYKCFINHLQGMPLIFSEVRHPDYVLSPPRDVVAAKGDPLFNDLVQKRTSQSLLDESRTEYFDRHFGDILWYGRELEIHDPYILENLLKSNKGAHWLVFSNLKKYAIKLEITAAQPRKIRDKFGKPTESNSQYKSRCEETLKKVIESLSNVQGCNSQFGITLKVLPFEGTDKHDRFWRIAFDKGSVSFELSDGTETFKSEVLRGRRKPAKLETWEYEEKAKTWQVDPLHPTNEDVHTCEFSSINGQCRRTK